MRKDNVKNAMRTGKKKALIITAALLVFAGTSVPFAVHAETATNTSATATIRANNGLDGWHKPNPQQQRILAQNLGKKLSIDAQTVETLMQQGYHPIDIAMAGLLSQTTHKSITDVLALKKINNNWHDVAKQLGVDENTFKSVLQKLRAALAEERNNIHRPRPNPNPTPTPDPTPTPNPDPTPTPTPDPDNNSPIKKKH